MDGCPWRPLEHALSRVRRLRTRAQFEMLLAQRPVARTAHFALHRVRSISPGPGEVAGGGAPGSDQPSLGALVPKRWARRAVTRNLIRRQIHAVGDEALAASAGAHLIRLHAAFPVSLFPSASSEALRRVVRAELHQLLNRPLP